MSLVTIIKKETKSILTRQRKVYVTINHVGKNELLQNKNAVVIGGDSGIGLSISKRIVDAGGNVIIVGRNEEKLRSAVAEIIPSDNCLGWKKCDISKYEECIQIVDEADGLIKSGKIDILVNSAGTNGTIRNYLSVSEEEWDIIFNTNIKGTFFISQQFIKYLIDNNHNGHILNICSVTGVKGSVLPYGLSKWSMIGYTKGLGKQFASKGIIVNGIAPGATATKMMGVTDIKDDMSFPIPSGRFTHPEEIADLAVFMCSDLGANMAGEVINYDGGESMV